ncbi:hypothetical protein [Streptomyces sp. NPDC018693]|uniref:hypothetical protein n=1 Tax=unclassified Streptomyces TaxID=2593676 RepID=UPI0037ACA2A4
MSDNDISMLAIGVTLGAYLMLAVQMVFQALDDRRDRRIAHAAQAKLKAARDRAGA